MTYLERLRPEGPTESRPGREAGIGRVLRRSADGATQPECRSFGPRVKEILKTPPLRAGLLTDGPSALERQHGGLLPLSPIRHRNYESANLAMFFQEKFDGY
jgi:hypothetical protein